MSNMRKVPGSLLPLPSTAARITQVAIHHNHREYPPMAKARPKYTYDYPRPAVTVDVVVATHEDRPRVLLIRRKHDPFAGMWAIPGGFVDMDETLEAAGRRELFEETGIRVDELEQLHTFGDPKRDPRGRTISVVYLARADAVDLRPQAADDAAEVGWHPLHRLPSLAFDHAAILKCARRRLKE
jgi:8-oxo-dGTP diphosphatase